MLIKVTMYVQEKIVQTYPKLVQQKSILRFFLFLDFYIFLILAKEKIFF